MTFVVAVAFAVALGGCAGLGSSPTVSPTASERPTPSPTAAAAPTPTPLPADGLFQINAVATASNGAIADLVETTYLPAAPSGNEVALLDSQCNYPAVPALQGQPSWESQYPRTVYMHTTIVANLRPGSPAWPNSTDPVIFSFVPVSAYTGSYTVLQASCTAGSITVPGTVQGVAPLWGSAPASGPYGWATPLGSYGFTGGGNDPGGPSPGTAVVTDCTVQLSPTASGASPSVAAWTTRAFDRQTGCVFVG